LPIQVHRKVRLWLAWILGIAFFWLARPLAASLWIGGAIVVAGLLIRGWAAGVLEKDRALATSGPYAFTRNPLYLGSFLLGTGAAVAGGRPVVGVAFLGFFAVVYGSTMARESIALEARFPEGYRHYRDAVPGFLPGLARYRPPPRLGLETTAFSLTRYIRNREYEALLGAVGGMGLLALKATGALQLP
jgi:protein-S-isoprenylcysteine O-methyltransferase Ste14